MDMWNRQKDSGKNMAEVFAHNGVGILKASNNRIQGWMAVKEMLKPLKNEEDKSGLLVTKDCKGLIRNIRLIQHDEKNPSDCATEPHSITHVCDALRYYCITRTLGAERVIDEVWDEDEGMDYDSQMTGGEMDESYLAYGGE